MTLIKSQHFSIASDIVYFNGDAGALLSEIPNDLVQLIVTSPPYNLGKEYEEKSDLNTYILNQETIISECVRVLSPEGNLCWQVGNYVENGEIIPLDIILFPIFAKLNLKLRNRIVWHYGHGLHATNRFSGRYEVILWFTKTDKYYFNLDPIRVPQKYPGKKYYKGPKKGQLSGNPLGKNPSDIWNIPNVKSNHIEKTEHPCQFPVELIERLVLSMSRKGDWVLDPFMGVATSAIASLLHERKSIGAEIRNDYFEIGSQRIEKAERGELQIRPMNRPIYDPNERTDYVPPKVVTLKQQIRPEQSSLFEKGKEYIVEERNAKDENCL